MFLTNAKIKNIHNYYNKKSKQINTYENGFSWKLSLFSVLRPLLIIKLRYHISNSSEARKKKILKQILAQYEYRILYEIMYAKIIIQMIWNF